MRVRSEAGFSYIDVMIAIVILMVGILALMSGLAGAVLRSKGQEQQLAAKQIAASTMESIMSVKETDTATMGWMAVGNVGSNLDPLNNPHGIFVTGLQNVRADAGPDEVMGTADDSGAVLNGFQRQIVITDICDPERPSANCPTPGDLPIMMRTVDITVTYFLGQQVNQERISTVLTDYSLPN
ncbi:MAG TPA: hypothetical protein VK468_02150 [Pyrinomonadaceae bacterium]|nr:hypothetical protein [Pyrinomonadaceae bacterium]